MNFRRREAACFLLATCGTFALWFFSMPLFQGPSPWAHGLQPYLLSLLALGAACQLMFHTTPKLIYAGAVVGGALGAVWPAFELAQLCVPCQVVPMLLFPMAAPFGAWVASLVR